MIKYFSLLFLFFFINLPDLLASQDKDNSLIVEADNSIEYFENEKYYLASGNAVVKKKNTTLKANVIKAFFKSNDQIKLIQGIGNVSLVNKNILAKGEHVKYDLKNQTILFSKGSQSFKSSGIYIESKEFLSYDNLKKRAYAKGNVKIILDNQNKIFADKIEAKFNKSDNSLIEATGKGKVKIILKSGNKSYANYAKFEKKTNLVKLIGNVKILKNNSSISGEKGTTNLKTGESIISSNKTNKRVKGKFIPYKNN